MSAVSETIVREYFERHSFFIRQPRKYLAPIRRDDEEMDFFVLNPRYHATGDALPAILNSEDLPRVNRAVISVKAWHTEVFTAALLTKNPELMRFASPAFFGPVARRLGEDGPLLKILVVPALPQGAEARKQSIELLRGKGVDAVILFRTILVDLVEHVEANRSYPRSDVLQVIRLLKHYDFLKGPQMELFRAKRRRKNP